MIFAIYSKTLHTQMCTQRGGRYVQMLNLGGLKAVHTVLFLHFSVCLKFFIIKKVKLT